MVWHCTRCVCTVVHNMQNCKTIFVVYMVYMADHHPHALDTTRCTEERKKTKAKTKKKKKTRSQKENIFVWWYNIWCIRISWTLVDSAHAIFGYVYFLFLLPLHILVHQLAMSEYIYVYWIKAAWVWGVVPQKFVIYCEQRWNVLM